MSSTTLRRLIVICLIMLWELLPRAGFIRNWCWPRATWARTPSQRLVRVIIPAAIPTVLSGFRVGGALVIVGVVGSEMLISSAGIGNLISRYRIILDSPHVFAGVLLVRAMAMAFNAAIKWIERKASIWLTGTHAGRLATGDIPAAIQPAT